MRVLVTRPEPDAMKLAARIEALDHEVTVEPLMAVDFADCEHVDLSEAQALIATSRNGLRGLKAQRADRIGSKLPLFAVGPGTAAEARKLGFELILAGKGTALDLIPEIVANVDPQAGMLVQLAGDTLAVDIAGELQHHGFRVAQPIVYRMKPAEKLSVDTLTQLQDGEIDAVLLLSPRTAEIWVSLLARYNLKDAARRILHVCLSPAVARRLAPLGSIRIETAAEPTLDEVLALIATDTVMAQGRPRL
jgi:uroporphyrinogen-III synthase